VGEKDETAVKKAAEGSPGQTKGCGALKETGKQEKAAGRACRGRKNARKKKKKKTGRGSSEQGKTRNWLARKARAQKGENPLPSGQKLHRTTPAPQKDEIKKTRRPATQRPKKKKKASRKNGTPTGGENVPQKEVPKCKKHQKALKVHHRVKQVRVKGQGGLPSSISRKKKGQIRKKTTTQKSSRDQGRGKTNDPNRLSKARGPAAGGSARKSQGRKTSKEAS